MAMDMRGRPPNPLLPGSRAASGLAAERRVWHGVASHL